MDHSEIVERFIVKVSNPKDKETRKNLGLSARELELFLTALNALENPSSESLGIPHLNRIAQKLEISTQYIQLLKKKGYITQGSKLGEWNVTDKAIVRMDSFLKNELRGPLSKKVKKTRKQKPSKKVPAKKYKKKKRTKKVSRKTSFDFKNMKVGEVEQYLDQIDMKIQALSEERDALKKKLQDFLRAYVK